VIAEIRKLFFSFFLFLVLITMLNHGRCCKLVLTALTANLGFAVSRIYRLCQLCRLVLIIADDIQVKDSLLAAMFSGRWESSHTYDSEGRIFLDYRPVCFQKIVNYLRHRVLLKAMGKSPHTDEFHCMGPDDEQECHCHDLIDYLGLTQYMGFVKIRSQPDGGI